jgi:hypothetical protein
MSNQERDPNAEQDRLAPELSDKDIAAELAADIAAGYGQERMSPEEFFAEIERRRQDPEFREALDATIAEHQDILDRLAE